MIIKKKKKKSFGLKHLKLLLFFALILNNLLKCAYLQNFK